MGKPFKLCPECGAHLDAGEPCDCGQRERNRPAPPERERMKLIAICREVDRETGEISVYPLGTKITGDVLDWLQYWARFNPEYRYFTIVSTRWEKYGDAIAGILKRRTVTRADLDRIGGIVEL